MKPPHFNTKNVDYAHYQGQTDRDQKPRLMVVLFRPGMDRYTNVLALPQGSKASDSIFVMERWLREKKL